MFSKTSIKRSIVSVLALFAMLASSVAAAAPAEASAYGCTPYTKVRIKGVSPANWCGGPQGTRRYISSVDASFASSFAGVGYLCNTRMKVEVFNSQGRSVYVAYSRTRTGCWQAGGVFRIIVNRTFASDGYVATSLLSYGATLATLNHNIKA